MSQLTPSATNAITTIQEIEAGLARAAVARDDAARRAADAQASLDQLQPELDRITAEIDLAAAAEAMGEPGGDVAALRKQLAGLQKDATAARTVLASASSAARGLDARISADNDRLTAQLPALDQALGEVRLDLRNRIDAVLEAAGQDLRSRLTPLLAAYLALRGDVTPLYQGLRLQRLGDGVDQLGGLLQAAGEQSVSADIEGARMAQHRLSVRAIG